jgi:hypothetical protein
MVNRTGKGQFRPGQSGNVKGRPKGLPENIVKMASQASPEAMQWLIDVAHGRETKGITADLRFKCCVAVTERAYGRPPQNISLDIALKRAIERNDPAEQLRILRDMRSAWVDHLAASPVIELEPAE